VGTESGGVDGAEVAGEYLSRDVPQPGGAVPARRGERAPVGCERHGTDPVTVSGQDTERAGVARVGDVPQPGCAVAAAAGQRPPAVATVRPSGLNAVDQRPSV